jgi:hypothetical protein
VTKIKDVGFVLFQVIRSLQNLFGNGKFVPMHKPLDPNAWSKIQNNKLFSTLLYSSS